MKFEKVLLHGLVAGLFLLVGIISLTMVQEEAEATITTQGLVGHWKLDESYGTTVYDSSGQVNNGVRSGGSITYGIVDRGFDAANSGSIEIDHDSSLCPANEITLSAWIKTSNAESHDNIVSQGFLPGTRWYSYGLKIISDGRIGFCADIGGTDRAITTQSSIQWNMWTHIAATYDGSNMKIYINGEQQGCTGDTGTVTGSFSYYGLPVYIGRFNPNPYGGPCYFNGRIDDVRIYDQDLDYFEINDMLLLGQWGLDSRGDNLIPDSSGYGNDGVKTGGTYFNDPWGGSNLRFDGNDHVKIDHNIAPDVFTIAMWVVPANAQNHDNLFSRQGTAGPLYYSYGLKIHQSGKIAFYAGVNTQETCIVSRDSIRFNARTHIAAVYDGTCMKLYFNSIEQECTGSTGPLSGPIGYNDGKRTYMGRYDPSYPHPLYYEGRLNRVHMYGKALTHADIQGLVWIGGTRTPTPGGSPSLDSLLSACTPFAKIQLSQGATYTADWDGFDICQPVWIIGMGATLDGSGMTSGSILAVGHSSIIEDLNIINGPRTYTDDNGIRVDDRFVRIRACSFSDCENGVTVGNSYSFIASSIIIKDCTFSLCSKGVWIKYSPYNTIEQCRFTGDFFWQWNSPQYRGIYLTDDNNHRSIDTVIEDCEFDVYLTAGITGSVIDSVTVTGCDFERIRSYSCGIIISNCDNWVIHHNNFISKHDSTALYARDENGNNNAWDDGATGNYWADYTTYPNPYSIYGTSNSVDNYPNLTQL